MGAFLYNANPGMIVPLQTPLVDQKQMVAAQWQPWYLRLTQLGQRLAVLQAIPFALVPAANSKLEGSVFSITDCNTNVWGAVAAGGGANHVLIYCNGTAWTVMAK